MKDGLKVVNATERDAGIYICSAEIDNAGLLESKSINVTVHGKIIKIVVYWRGLLIVIRLPCFLIIFTKST